MSSLKWVKTFFLILNILDEVTSNEVWGQIDEKEKQKEQELLNKFKVPSIASKLNPNITVSKISLELSEADRIISEQKKIIGELETNIRAVKTVNQEKEDKKIGIQKKFEETKLNHKNELEELKKLKEEKLKRNA
jgi:hypothetical protein